MISGVFVNFYNVKPPAKTQSPPAEPESPPYCKLSGDCSAPCRCDLFVRLSEKSDNMPLLRAVPPQKSIFCGADFGSTIALDQCFPTF